MAATLKTISERVGISQAAVSMILNHRSNDLSSAATKEKVFTIAKELNYKQKFGHKVLRGDKTRSVVIMIAMRQLLMEEPIQQLVLRLLDRFEKENYTPYLMTIPETDNGDLEMTQELIQRGIDHFIVIGCPSHYAEMEEKITRNGRTIIGFNSHFSRNLSNDVQHEVRMTVRKFVDSGCENFRIIASRNTAKINAITAEFPELSKKEVVKKYVCNATFSEEVENIDKLSQYGYDTTKAILENDPDVSAIMYISDYHMLGGMRCILEKGLTIGKDITLCGVNNIHAVRNSFFPLWTWEIDIAKIADTLFDNCIGTKPFKKSIKPIFKKIM